MHFKKWLLLAAIATGCGDTRFMEGDSEVNGGPIGTPPVGVGTATCDWTQNMGGPSHLGKLCPAPHGLRLVGVLIQDPDAEAQASNPDTGFLQIHEGSPLTYGDFVAFPVHRGADPDDRSNDTWAVDIWRYLPSATAVHPTLTHVALVPSTWRAVDTIRSFGFVTNGYVQQEPLAFAGGLLLVPQASGRVSKVDPATGNVLATIDPFEGSEFSGDLRLTTASGFSVRADGTLYYSATAWPTALVPTNGLDPRGSWLIEVKPSGAVRLAPWPQIASSSVGVPQRNDLCNWPFGTSNTPQATGPDSVPPKFGCGFQRPKLNSSIAIRPTDGHLMVYSAATNNIWSAWIIDVDPFTLQPVWAMPTREHFLQGCGVRIPLTNSPEWGDACDVITDHGRTHIGYAPDFNLPGSHRGNGIDDSYVFCTATGDCGVGGYDGGFAFLAGGYDARGTIILVHADGSIAAVNDEVGWGLTPSLDSLGRFRLDRDLFSDAFDFNTGTIGPHPDTALQSAIYSTTFELTAISQIPVNFAETAIDLLAAQEPADKAGNAYTVDGSGILYQVGPDGSVRDAVPLIDPATGEQLSMETLQNYFAWGQGPDGTSRLYLSYAGKIWIFQTAGVDSAAPISAARLAALHAPNPKHALAIAAKMTASAKIQIPPPPQ